jgi:DNA replication licensing factor MCM3
MFLSGSMVRLKVVRSVHYCAATTKFMERQYSDFTNLKAFPSSSAYPTTVNYLLFAYCQKY